MIPTLSIRKLWFHEIDSAVQSLTTKTQETSDSHPTLLTPTHTFSMTLQWLSKALIAEENLCEVFFFYSKILAILMPLLLKTSFFKLLFLKPFLYTPGTVYQIPE